MDIIFEGNGRRGERQVGKKNNLGGKRDMEGGTKMERRKQKDRKGQKKELHEWRCEKGEGKPPHPGSSTVL